MMKCDVCNRRLAQSYSKLLSDIGVSGRIKLTHLGSLQTDPPFAALF